MPVPEGPEPTGGPFGGSKGGSAPAFGNISEYSKAKSREMYRNKIKNHNRTGTTMKVHSYQRGVGNNTKVNSYRTNSANTNNNRHNTSNITRLNQRNKRY